MHPLWPKKFALPACTALALCACGKPPPDPPATGGQPPPAAAASAIASGGDASVPAAAAVITPGTATPPADAAAGRTNRSMSKAEESAAMPLPGQNNDHSAPMAPARGASAP